MICPLTRLTCLQTCGGSHGNRCPAAPSYDHPSAIAGFADPRVAAAYAGKTLTAPGAFTVALAQLTEQGATDPSRLSAGFFRTPAGHYLPLPPTPLLYVTPAEYAAERGVGMVERVFAGQVQVLFTVSDGRRMVFGFGRQQVPVDLADHPWLKARQVPLPSSLLIRSHDTQPSPLQLERIVTVSELVGWRIWAVRSDRLLKSFAYDDIWKPGIPMHGVPQDDGTAGVWAFKTRRRAIAKAAENRNRNEKGILGYAWGAVAMWGEAIEHAYGWRAEYVRIISLDGVVTPRPKEPSPVVSRRPRRILTGLRRCYGVAGFAKVNMAQLTEIAE